MENQVFISSPTQQDYQLQLQRMVRENYHQFRQEDLKRALYAYFFFLERAITGEEQTAYADRNFSISELEGIISEMEPHLANTAEQKRRAAELLGLLSGG